MAKFSIKPNETGDYYIDIGTGTKHDSTSWWASKDKYFNKIIDKSEKDPVNLLEWVTPLPKLDEDKTNIEEEEYYSDLETLYIKAVIHCGEFSSNEIILGPINQNEQKIYVTNSGEIIKETTTNELGWVSELKDNK